MTDSITGYVNGEGSGVLFGSPTLSTTATAYNGTAGSGSNAGTYTITAGNGTLSAANYDFTHRDQRHADGEQGGADRDRQ